MQIELKKATASVLAACALLWSAVAARADDLRVVASVPPLYFLVTAVTEGAREPELLIPAGASPHNYALRPSDMRALANADLIFWVGPALEAPLARPLATKAIEGRVITLGREPALNRLRQREPGTALDHVSGEAGAPIDPHLWLDPANALAIVDIAVAALSDLDPDRADLYARNGAAEKARIAKLDVRLEQRLAPVRHLSFITFHDAYQYLEARYDLRNLGFVVQYPEHPTAGARHLSALRDRAARLDARCIFIEPEYAPRLARPVVEGTDIRVATLDHMGAGLPLSGDAYFRLMDRLADDLVTCLTGRND